MTHEEQRVSKVEVSVLKIAKYEIDYVLLATHGILSGNILAWWLMTGLINTMFSILVSTYLSVSVLLLLPKL